VEWRVNIKTVSNTCTLLVYTCMCIYSLVIISIPYVGILVNYFLYKTRKKKVRSCSVTSFLLNSTRCRVISMDKNHENCGHKGKKQWLQHFVMLYKVVQIWPGLIVCKQVTVCPGHIWTTLYFHTHLSGTAFCNRILQEHNFFWSHESVFSPQ
jgi:hypothetical protein